MAKLYFRFGAVSSAKTLLLLAVEDTYERQGKTAVILKPDTDDREAEIAPECVRSKIGLQRTESVMVLSDRVPNLATMQDFIESQRGPVPPISCILVEEAQFFSPAMVDQLRAIADAGTPVICYGLRTNFLRELFAGSKRLLELADTIEEVKTTCARCNKKGIFNLRVDSDGTAMKEGPVILIGGAADAKKKKPGYLPVCSRCYNAAMRE